MNGKLRWVTSLLALCALIISGCTAVAAQSAPEVEINTEPTAVEATGAGMANPASVFCGEQGGTLDIRTDADGGQYGVCVFADGSECDEWAFFRGECEANAPEAAASEAVVPEVAVQPVDGWCGFVITPPAGQPFDVLPRPEPQGVRECRPDPGE